MGQKTIQSLERGLDILFLFTEKKPALTIEEIASLSGLPKSTCYRVLKTFKKKNLIELNGDPGKYKLGVRLLKIESVIHKSIKVAAISMHYLQELSTISGETAELVILNKDEAVCIEKVDSAETLRVMPDKGAVMGLHSGASGKVIMAYLSEEQQNKIIEEKGLKKFTAYTIIDPILLKRHLQKIRKVGYATSDQEFSPGVRALAAPIFNLNNKIIASICVVGPRERLTSRKISLLIDDVLEASREITKRLGGETKQQVKTN